MSHSSGDPSLLFLPPDEQLKVLNEKNKELEAAQDRNAALQVLLGLGQGLKSLPPLALCSTDSLSSLALCSTECPQLPGPLQHRVLSVPSGVCQDQYQCELMDMFTCPRGLCAGKWQELLK